MTSRRSVATVLALLGALTLVPAGAAAAQEASCWGQATKVFVATGTMGEHASEQATPRLGLRNLARALYDAGVLEDDTMAALGAFVAAELGLAVEACT